MIDSFLFIIFKRKNDVFMSIVTNRLRKCVIKLGAIASYNFKLYTSNCPNKKN
ncbi:hypothetical protein GCM10007342_09760 [Staphylococcus pragensis]|nr:hypothetical protein GCM10007342_09760 [Staphylococcus pragensis]